MELEKTFLSKEELDKFKVNFTTFKLISTETYNETIISKSIEQIGSAICGPIAIQLAIIGYGNKNYGDVIINDKKINIQEFFTNNNVNIKCELNAKLKVGELTPRRLIRFYRQEIGEYLKVNLTMQSYIYKKYCYSKTEVNRVSIYPGIEHLLTSPKDNEIVKILLDTYKVLDEKRKTNIREKIIRVLSARGFTLTTIATK